jgi:hypothetical protein
MEGTNSSTENDKNTINSWLLKIKQLTIESKDTFHGEVVTKIKCKLAVQRGEHIMEDNLNKEDLTAATKEDVFDKYLGDIL